MIHHQISCSNPTSQFIQIRLSLEVWDQNPISLQLPAWRAGRYQLANYAQNIRRLRVLDGLKKDVKFEKTTKDCWTIYPENTGQIQVDYEYWAGRMDAGGAWADDEQIYANLVNCCFEVLERSGEEIGISLDLPDYPVQISTLTAVSDSNWRAENFQILADSTALAAKSLTHCEYKTADVLFHIWIHGEVHFDKTLLLDRFSAFTEKLIVDFGAFPELEYHFIFQLLPYPHYHGVEHRRGTVITFGPAESLKESTQMEELLGVSCHELYHAWNVCRIRPKELLQYDFSKESYTRTGLVLEGVTTYMGDLYLLKSGVYTLETYLKHFEKIVNREASSSGWKSNNILESSFDLWLDGYVPGIPDRKVNIYSRGALLAFCLDILLLEDGRSLAEVMRKMWDKFGRPFIGYGFQDFEELIFSSSDKQMHLRDFFQEFVYGYGDLFAKLPSFFEEVGITMMEQLSEDWLLHQMGIRTNADGTVLQLHPEASASFRLMKNDKILNWPLEKPDSDTPLKIQVDRYGRRLELVLSLKVGRYYPYYSLQFYQETEIFQKWKA
jgi:predicted metalloprotease with PDZ domain